MTNDNDEYGFVQVMAFLPETSSVWNLFTHSVIALNYKFDNLKLITPWLMHPWVTNRGRVSHIPQELLTHRHTNTQTHTHKHIHTIKHKHTQHFLKSTLALFDKYYGTFRWVLQTIAVNKQISSDFEICWQ